MDNQIMTEVYVSFSVALQQLKYGAYLARKNWNGKNMWIKLIQSSGELTHPFLGIEYPKGSTAYPSGSVVPWTPSQTDILADDWFIVKASSTI
jgi:hypothetical protein